MMRSMMQEAEGGIWESFVMAAKALLLNKPILEPPLRHPGAMVRATVSEPASAPWLAGLDECPSNAPSSKVAIGSASAACCSLATPAAKLKEGLYCLVIARPASICSDTTPTCRLSRTKTLKHRDFRREQRIDEVSHPAARSRLCKGHDALAAASGRCEKVSHEHLRSHTLLPIHGRRVCRRPLRIESNQLRPL